MNGRMRGNGSVDSPFLIEDIFDFDLIRNTIYVNKNYYFKLVNDIDFDVYPFNITTWIPIDGFLGSLDGGGFALKNVKLSSVNTGARTGIFKTITVGGSSVFAIKNLVISNCIANWQDAFQGILIGYLELGSSGIDRILFDNIAIVNSKIVSSAAANYTSAFIGYVVRSISSQLFYNYFSNIYLDVELVGQLTTGLFTQYNPNSSSAYYSRILLTNIVDNIHSSAVASALPYSKDFIIPSSSYLGCQFINCYFNKDLSNGTLKASINNSYNNNTTFVEISSSNVSPKFVFNGLFLTDNWFYNESKGPILTVSEKISGLILVNGTDYYSYETKMGSWIPLGKVISLDIFQKYSFKFSVVPSDKWLLLNATTLESVLSNNSVTTNLTSDNDIILAKQETVSETYNTYKSEEIIFTDESEFRLLYIEK